MTRAGLVVVAVLGIGCGLEDSAIPPLAGPSSLAMSLTLAASPDTLVQDGRSQSLVTVEARDSSARAIPNLSLAIDLEASESSSTGRISARSVVTDANGRAAVVYTAPARTRGSLVERVIVIVVTPVGTDFGSQTPRRVHIRLRPV